MIPRAMARNGWTVWHLITGVVMVTFGFALTIDVWLETWRVALDEQAGYLVLVPFVALWLVYVRRQRFLFCSPVGTWIGPVLVAIGWLVNTLGLRGELSVIWEAGALLMVVGCLLSAVGTDVVKRFYPAFVVLIFLIPIPDAVAPQLAQPIHVATADITQTIYGWLGLDLERQGNMILIDGVSVSLAKTGSVISVMMAFILMSYAFAFGLPLRTPVRMVILAISPVTALLCNVGRLLATAWLYGPFEPEQVGHVLDFSGWVMIGAALACLYGVVKLLAWSSVPIRRYSLAYD